MIKLVLSLAAIFAFGLANAQETITNEGFSKGDAFISGSVGFNTRKTGDRKTNTFNVSPKAGYFLTSNIALGANLVYNSTNNDIFFNEFGLTKEKIRGFEAGVFGRYYFTPADKFSIFAQFRAAFSTAHYEVESTEHKVNGFNVQLAPAISYFITSRLALEAIFGIVSYNTVNPKENNDGDFYNGAESTSTDTFEIGLNLSDINFGVVYKF